MIILVAMMCLFSQLYIIFILLINNNPCILNKDIYVSISIISLRAAWNGNNGNDSEPPPYSYNIPGEHALCDTRPSVQHIPSPPPSPTPAIISHRQHNYYGRTGRDSSQLESMMLPPPYSFYGHDGSGGISRAENLNLYGESFKINFLSVNPDNTRSNSEKLKLYDQIRGVIKDIMNRSEEKTKAYLIKNSEYKEMIENHGEDSEVAKIARAELRKMYSQIKNLRDSYEYHLQCLEKVLD